MSGRLQFAGARTQDVLRSEPLGVVTDKEAREPAPGLLIACAPKAHGLLKGLPKLNARDEYDLASPWMRAQQRTHLINDRRVRRRHARARRGCNFNGEPSVSPGTPPAESFTQSAFLTE